MKLKQRAYAHVVAGQSLAAQRDHLLTNVACQDSLRNSIGV